MYRKMISDGIILVGLVLIVIGWGGRGVVGIGGIFGWFLIILGAVLVVLGLIRYSRGHGTE